jgi:hypothetical protein
MIAKGQISLIDGTLVRHKVKGYEGRIEGTTEIKVCFTRGGVSVPTALSKEQFQYRVVVVGESLRRIAPLDDLEIVEESKEIVCSSCKRAFRTTPGLVDKPAGRCECGGFICPTCWRCRIEEPTASKTPETSCSKERKRLARKHTIGKKKPSISKTT